MTLVASLIGGDKALDRPRGATDEEPVDVGKRGEGPGITGVDAAAVEDRDLGTGPSEQICAPRPDQFGNRCNVLGAGRGASGADRPDRLISDLNLSQVLRLNSVQADSQLSQYRLTADAERSLLGRLAHGE